MEIAPYHIQSGENRRSMIINRRKLGMRRRAKSATSTRSSHGGSGVRRWPSRVGILALLLIAPAVMTAREAPKVQSLDIVDRAIEFHGGDLYKTSETVLELCSKSGCYGVTSVVDGGLFEYTVTGRLRGVERRVRATNEEVQLWENGSPVVVADDQQQRLRDWAVARVYFCFLPFRLDDDSVFKQDLGIEMWDGRPLHRVKITFSPGSSTDAEDDYIYWFDPESGRVEQFAYSFTGNPGGLRFRRPFNYRRVGGLLFFDQENFGLAGDDLSVDDLDPEMVESMSRVSTVQLKMIRVRPLE